MGVARSARPSRRVLAFLLDLGLVAGWALVAALVGMSLLRMGVALSTPAARDAFAFFTLVLPVTVTLAVQDSSSRQGTFGKRRIGLAVVDLSGERVSIGRSLARSGLKLLPWQLAHSAVFRLVQDPASGGWLAVSILAQVIVLVSLLTVVFSERRLAIHDLIAGTRVVQRD